MTSSEPVALPFALFGGTFDPVHRGHIEPLLQLADTFGWAAVYLQPTFSPPHRPPPIASDQQRIEMLQIAAKDDKRLIVDDFELRQGKPTRTVHTLQYLRSQHPHSALCFILGMDSFIQFNSWLNWQEILTLSHLIVLPRPGYSAQQLPAVLQAELRQRQSNSPTDFLSGSGLIYMAETAPVDISATQLREVLSHSAACPEQLHPAVYQYIKHNGLYR